MSGARRMVLTAIAAILGIAVAAAITWGTSQLVRQHIGLASEPPSAGLRLLPAPTPTTSTRSTSTPPSTASTSTTTTPSTTRTPGTTPATEAPATEAPVTPAPTGEVPAGTTPAGGGRTGSSSPRREGDSGSASASHRDD